MKTFIALLVLTLGPAAHAVEGKSFDCRQVQGAYQVKVQWDAEFNSHTVQVIDDRAETSWYSAQFMESSYPGHYPKPYSMAATLIPMRNTSNLSFALTAEPSFDDKPNPISGGRLSFGGRGYTYFSCAEVPNQPSAEQKITQINVDCQSPFFSLSLQQNRVTLYRHRSGGAGRLGRHLIFKEKMGQEISVLQTVGANQIITAKGDRFEFLLKRSFTGSGYIGHLKTQNVVAGEKMDFNYSCTSF